MVGPPALFPDIDAPALASDEWPESCLFQNEADPFPDLDAPATLFDPAELRALDTGNAPLFDLVAMEAEIVAAFGPPSRRRLRRK